MNEVLILKDLVDNLEPYIDDNGREFKINFDVGTRNDLQRFIINQRRSNKNVYPIIYMLAPYSYTEFLNTKKGAFEFVFAVSNPNIDMSNINRAKEIFEKIIDIVYKKFILAIENSNQVFLSKKKDREVKVFFGYDLNNGDEKDKESFTDYWDAKKVKLELKFKNC